MFSKSRQDSSASAPTAPQIPLTPDQAITAFRLQLAKTPPERLDEMRKLDAKKRAPFWAQWLEKDEPEVGAAKMLVFHDGDERDAEADAWGFFELLKAADEHRGNDDGKKWGSVLLNHILNKDEVPSIPRVAKERPRFH